MTYLARGVNNFEKTGRYNKAMKMQVDSTGINRGAGTARSLQSPNQSNLMGYSGLHTSRSSLVGPLMMAKDDDAEVTADATSEENAAITAESKAPLESKSGIKFGPYSWFVLAIIVGIRILYQW